MTNRSHPHEPFDERAARDPTTEQLRRIGWLLDPAARDTPPGTSDHRPAYGDLTELNTSRVILGALGKAMLDDIVSDFLELLETSSAVYEKNGDYALGIASSGWCRFLDAASRRACGTADDREALDCGAWLCHESCWTDASEVAIKTGEPTDIACNGGIRIRALPIRVGGEVVGAINMGYGDPPRDDETLRSLAERYGVSADELRTLAEQYESRPPFLVELAKRRLGFSARLIAEILERERAQAALRASEAHYRSLLDCIPDGVVVADASFVYVDVNESICRMLGYTRDELVGLHASQVVTPDETSQIGPGLFAELGSESGYQARWTMRRKDGSTFTAQVFANTTDEGLALALIRDITDSERVQTERHKFFRLAESTSEFIGMCDLEMQPQYVNPAGRRMVGLPDMEAACRAHVLDYFFPEDRAFIADEFFPSVLRDGEGEIEVRLRHFETGDTLWMQYYLFAVRDADGEAIGWATVSHDITARRRSEEHQRQLQDQLAQAQKMESIGQLAGGVAHDFNNMLSVILGHAEAAQAKLPPTEPLHEHLAAILEATHRSSGLTRQLLAFARRQIVEPRVLDLNEAIGDLLAMLERLIGENIQLAWRPALDLWPVLIDPAQVDQVLTNLCVNARDAIAGVGCVTIETANVWIDEQARAGHDDPAPGDYLRLTVRDDGCGMDEETLAHVFEPFFTTKEQGKGSGLGMATVYGAIKQNGGFLDVDSEVGTGTTITVHLPRHHGALATQPGEHPDRETAGGHETILLVEDQIELLQITAIMLEDAGYTVLAANTAAEALQVAQEHAADIRLLLSDVVMPERSGPDLARQLVAQIPGLKTVFMSGYTTDEILHRGVPDGDIHMIAKPFVARALLAKLREVLDGGPPPTD